MTECVEEWLLQNKDNLEKGIDIIGQASAVLAVTVGQFHPILEAVFQASYEIFSNPEGQNAKYLTEQFFKVNQNLRRIQAEEDQISRELQKSSLNKQHFDWEAQILNQYKKFEEFFNAKPNLKKEKMDEFLLTYEVLEEDLNLDALYNAFTGNASGGSMLQTVVETEQFNRIAVEDFCDILKKLFVKGIIAFMGYNSLKKKDVGYQMLKKWLKQMEQVEESMKKVIDDIIDNFAPRAKEDMVKQLEEIPGSVDLGFTKSILDTLKNKYDWVSWSIRVFNDKERIFFFNWLAGKKYHGSEGGANFFEVMTKNNIKVVISFSVQPKLINMDLIKEQIEGEKLKRNMMDVAQIVSRRLPNCQVHAVSAYKKVVESNNFKEGCYYYGKHQKVYICVHPN
ncbi:protein rapunzel-like [Oncorhynchus clarkii lewisi]|uniref:protein rapunzel-like n=1 Tax=Oncorhynchus clarkii lewisi TaxID=490388 RepID=UPI0039B92DF6